MIKKYLLISFLILVLILPDKLWTADTGNKSYARIWEENITIPTYVVGRDGENPRFYFGRAYQGAQGRIYPYSIQERLTDERVDKTYKALYLENEYIRTSLLPEIGGRIFSALDKHNNYDFIYRQHVIKPALVGMLGAWITGGVEWNVFHHHRATSFSHIDYAIQNNSDGSVTAWVGEIELRHRMKWRIGVTLHPGKSYIQATLIPYNRSPFIHSFLYFANAGVHAGPDYQVIFPPSTEWVTQHAKREFASWPIAHQVYNRVDFSALGRELGTDGVDISWWKNNIKQISFFCYNYENDWMAGYDHGRETGTCVVGNHHIAPGRKFWTWGNGPKGRLWDKLLTETDGPELELMAGGFSDNEPDYSWIQPFETKTVSFYFYPIHNMGGVKNANLEAAVNLEIVDPKVVRIALNTTSKQDQAKVILSAEGKVIFEQILDIDPNKSYTKELSLPFEAKKKDLRVSLLSSQGEELIAYQTMKTSPGAFPGLEYEGNLQTGEKAPMPEPVKPSPLPNKVESAEQLYLTGMRLEQFYHPSVDPMPYYQEALKRDPGHSLVNTAVGILYLRKAMFAQAEKHLKTAVERATWNYTHPRDTEPFYYYGLALRHLGKLKEAYDNFYQATWDHDFHSAAYYQLAELDCRKGQWKKVLEHLERSLSTNINNLKALDLKATVLRKQGKYKAAAELSSQTSSDDLLDFWSRNEMYLNYLALGQKSKAEAVLQCLQERMRDDYNSYLELATDYGNCGLWDEALDILKRLIEMNKKGASTYPMLYYYAGYYSSQKGNKADAAKYYQLAEEMPPDYCFPFRLESIDALRAAIQHNPNGARAYYYLGNLLYDLQPKAAIKEWEKSKNRGGNFATLYRNLGLGYDKTLNNREKSIACYKKAIELDSKDTRIIYELDHVYEKVQVPPEKRLAFLQKYHETCISDDLLLPLQKEISLYVRLGQYDQALEMMKPHHFRRWEGGTSVHNIYIDANILRGLECMKKQKFEKALEYIKSATELPLNLEAFKPFASGRSCEVFYYLGELYEARGNKEKAKEAYKKAVVERQYYDWYSTPHYYRGMALKKLGRRDEAILLFEALINQGNETLNKIETSSGLSFFAKFGEKETEEVRKARAHYHIGLGLFGKGEKAKSKAEFKKTAKLDINHLWARFMLSKF